MVYTCRSFDIVAHEAGHAYLDALKPSWWGYDGQTGAFHESFGDLTVRTLCSNVLAKTDLALKVNFTDAFST
jgi:Zn-dependent metalloprotease